mgnify:FL=1
MRLFSSRHTIRVDDKNEHAIIVVADVIVHRLLAASLDLFKLPTVFHDKAQLNNIADSELCLVQKRDLIVYL